MIVSNRFMELCTLIKDLEEAGEMIYTTKLARHLRASYCNTNMYINRLIKMKVVRAEKVGTLIKIFIADKEFFNSIAYIYQKISSKPQVSGATR